jgi:hypothetical protein
VYCLRDVYLDGKHMTRSSLDLLAIASDRSTGSDVQDQLRFHQNWFDNVDRISDKYRLNSNGAKTIP